MNLLIKILQAAHCRSTHQYFVLDAIPLVSTPRGQKFGRVLLRHYEAYLLGSKDPDKRFRDFRNHVLHVRDNHWGGAPKTAEKWYRKLLERMDAGDWEQAAYSAGVLSHYFTDPLMPLHTAQSEKETVIHRAMEWSVTKSYQSLSRAWSRQATPMCFDLPHGPGWLSKSICYGAAKANEHYDDLVNRYDLAIGSKNPKQGLDAHSRGIFTDLFGMAISGWAQVLERAADETRSGIPRQSLLMKSVVATINMPTAWITRRIESGEERAAVQAIFDEFTATGKVEKNLPAESRVVREERELDRVTEKLRDAQVATNEMDAARVRTANIVVEPSPTILANVPEQPKVHATGMTKIVPDENSAKESPPNTESENERESNLESESNRESQSEAGAEKDDKHFSEPETPQEDPKPASANEPLQRLVDREVQTIPLKSVAIQPSEKASTSEAVAAADDVQASPQTVGVASETTIAADGSNRAAEDEQTEDQPTDASANAERNSESVDFRDRDRIRQQFHSAMDSARREIQDSDRHRERIRTQAESRVVRARQRRDIQRGQHQPLGSAGGGQPNDSGYTEKRRLAVPTVPTIGVGEKTSPARATIALSSSRDSQTDDNTPEGSRRSRKPNLALADDLVDAPSIGPKTARRFEKIGIHTVGEFLEASPDQMAEALATRWITKVKLNDWQDQARLACQLPGVCGYKTQLLVGVDCRNVEQLAQQIAEPLHQTISEFAESSEGQRILRSSSVPPRTEVARWINDAQSAKPLSRSA